MVAGGKHEAGSSLAGHGPGCKSGNVEDRFWGLTPAEWTAIGTIALAAVGIITVIVGAAAARQSSRSAAATESAAKATRELVGAQLSEVEVDFEVNLVFNEVPEAPAAVRLTWHRPLVTLHGVTLEFVDMEIDGAVWGPLTCDPIVSLPRRVSHGELVYFMWPGPLSEEQAIRHNEFKVVYSFSEDGERFSRTVSARSIAWR